MFKNKTTSYILLVLVALIWGIIASRFLNLTKKNDGSYSKQNLTKNKNEIKSDTFSISVNYSDPFLTNISSIQYVDKIKNTIPIEKSNLQSQIVWPSIYYFGFVKKSRQDCKTGLAKLDNKEYVVKEGEIIHELEIKKIMNDSIVIVYKNMTKSFKCIKQL
jgi:hypothetical protein